MNILDIRAQIEEEITWRSNEIRFLKNQLSNISKESDREKYRKSLVVMLYSHYEGFCKTLFLIYVHEINIKRISRSQVNNFIATASFEEAFRAYDNKDKKNKFFKKLLPEDEKLHRYSRQVDFLSAMDDLWKEKVVIPEKIIDTESNLKPVVLRKLLFRLGFPYDSFAHYEGKIDLLLNKRNNIAHGTEKEGINEDDYNKIEKATFGIIDELKIMIIKALENKVYLKEGIT
ncbi:MAE_28990/MAE_18760 family HEPN-like nuclease [Oceanobacillus salinisoli]|uniref:MAE_28990/MAE_18760 family HEPN-like nuclease n=1 Tax=Oceanobacillus salinisoli TaxID=2678611 RepID=UPI0012E24164|nr:MAE_28990/MAE_18760 family HEPN-like nuclease [Oceanobacillus salinisoli]